MTVKMNKKEPVRLRMRKTSTGLTSLYLDYYIKGKRSYEYLKMYLIPEKTRQDKEHNRQILATAEAIKAKRLVEIVNGEFGFKTKHNALLKDYFASLSENVNIHTANVYHSTWKHIIMYDRKADRLDISDVTTEWLNGFVYYLVNDAMVHDVATNKPTKKRAIKRNTASLYVSKIKVCISKAFKEGYISRDVTLGMDSVLMEDTKREYLTVEEVKLLINTPFKYEALKRAFLFSCLTGLRKCDVLALTWGDIVRQGEFTRIMFRQIKTSQQEYLDINEQASSLLGERGRPEEHPFHKIGTAQKVNEHLISWCKTAGINKHITFHSARHTFATMLLTLGTDLYTVSKLLGHRSIKSTQVYAKIIDEKKQQAINSIPDILG